MLKRNLMIALGLLLLVGFAACETDRNGEMTETNETAVTEDNEEMSGDGDRTAGEVLDDTVITTTVKAELLADYDVGGLDIDVDTNEGVVTLSGTVNSEMESVEAEAIAKSVDGVVSVTNNLVVDRTPGEDMEGTDAQDMDTGNTEENSPSGAGY